MTAGRRSLRIIILLGVFAALTATALAASTSASFGTAIEVPGSAALNLSNAGDVNSISCVSPGVCAAAGEYTDASKRNESYVVSEKGGVWGTAVEIPGLEALSGHGSENRVFPISCAKAGWCAVGGFYRDGNGEPQAFLVNEKNGVWGKAFKVPGMKAVGAAGGAAVGSISCVKAGFCTAGGVYFTSHDQGRAFFVTEKNGVWGSAFKLTGPTGFSSGSDTEVSSISCTTTLTCAAGGYYVIGASKLQAFVVRETSGVWRKAQVVPGVPAIQNGGSVVDSISCTASGQCAAGGSYTDPANLDYDYPFVVSEKNGVWTKATKLPGLGHGEIYSIACATTGRCVAGGYFLDASDVGYAFGVAENNGVWAAPAPVFGANAGEVDAVSCAKLGPCGAGGYYVDGAGHAQAFVVDNNAGVWGTATEVPGTAALNVGHAGVSALSCVGTGSCVAGGGYHDASGLQVFVTSP